jgi:dinuclear metal center YbgI/SA1388 family protein
MSTRLQEILALLETHWPLAWALGGDRVGLLVGNPGDRVDAALVALEVSPAVVAAARETGVQLLLTHHPLLYQPLAAVREDHGVGLLVADLIRSGVAHVACHTNLDAAPGGVNDYLARLLELEETEVLEETGREEFFKIAVFVPVGYEDQVRRALAEDRVGVIGNYAQCSFAARGQGTYLPLEGARPFKGQTAALSRVPESRLEVLAPAGSVAGAVARLKAAHPYEEPAFDLYPLENRGPSRGLGRVGRWPRPRPFPRVVDLVKEVFGVQALRIWGSPPPEVARLALCSGSGGDLLHRARERGAQVYLTGEVRHHQATPTWGPGFAVLEVGHFASEAVFMPEWARQLRSHFQDAGFNVRVEVAREEPPSAFL